MRQLEVDEDAPDFEDQGEEPFEEHEYTLAEAVQIWVDSLRAAQRTIAAERQKKRPR